MTGSLNLSLATWDHDRVMALHDGRVPVPGCAFTSHILPTGKLFPIAVQEGRFDITELSLSSHILQVARGDAAYVAIPAFVSRAFRHNGFYRRTGSGITSPSDFAGRAIGVPEYQMTAALWMRGIMADDHGVTPTQVHWRTGALDQGIRHERLALTPPPDLRITPIADGETLQDLLLAGEIDGLLAPNPPRAFMEGDPRIERVYPDFEQVEQEWHRRTGFFPIMHVIALRRTLAEEHPWLAGALYQALCGARDIALERLRDVWLGSANRLSLPWLNAAMERTRATMGPDYWPYGFAGARTEIAAMCRYSVDQFLAPRIVAPEELFEASLLET
ncbi:4,5-dihydroxyphthalate decarboxylase [Thetidibacter halocola]|uniref:4,5-dihydroxyphthalate decarboxylase n=1 Tax=Thetidibacter halocola TaxID=2827239 RepID=A0A8J8B6I3_9RHOB|nr:4,5-dihydroxyphthalate decarboxylase [Thetidibacter halocola]MBS0122595.1 4,5-dihydroxyphthalate decarboxylase [Thetidibacter halocola]